MIALQAEMPCWWDSSKKFKNPFFTITEITTVISRIASQNADHVEQSEIWGHNGHRLRWCFSTLQLDRAGLPPKPVRYCGCRWILNFTHNTFPCYRIHGNGLGIMETELMVFHVLLNLLETWLHWRSLPVHWSLLPEKLIWYLGGIDSAEVPKLPPPFQLNRFSNHQLVVPSWPYGLMEKSITKGKTQDLPQALHLENLEFV